jgi:Ca2+/Na+ antiporter
VKVTPGVRSCLTTVLLSKVISYTIALCLISICLLILHLSAAICEIWPLYFTYSIYLVLSLKLGVTKGGEDEYVRVRGSQGEFVRWIHTFEWDTLHASLFITFHASRLYDMWAFYFTYIYVMSLTLCSWLLCFHISLWLIVSIMFSTRAYFISWVPICGLVRISMPNPLFLLSHAYMNQVCWKSHPSILYTYSRLLSSITKKRGDWKHLGP